MEEILTGKMLRDIKAAFGLTIQQMAEYMNWPNTKYYHKILNGSKVSVDYLFNSLQHWFYYYPQYWDNLKKAKLIEIINKYLLFFIK